MRAAVLVTGDEVLGGRVGERNAGFLARSLATYGIRVERTLVVGDEPGDVRSGLAHLLALGVDLICTTGGLGPTVDDLTMEAVAGATGRAMRIDADALDQVRARSSNISQRYRVDAGNLERMRQKQATLPDGAVMLAPAGTAPGCILDHEGTIIVVLPGPPWELEDMWTRAVRLDPLAHALSAAPGSATRTLRLWATIEAELVEALDQLHPRDVRRLGTYTRDGELEIVVPNDLVEPVERILRTTFPVALFARSGELVDHIVADILRTRGEVLAVAESCTGGGLGARITSHPGSSEWFAGGVIAYANSVKTAVLGVPETLIAEHGAVSGPCAQSMAEGVKRLTGAAWGVSITGVAGPGGGSQDKPVGTVWIGLAGPDGASAFEALRLRGDRESVRRRAQSSALHHLRIALERMANAT